jgi:hypothetical protein
MALRALYGVDVLFWEPETIWLTLEREHGIDMTVEDRNKIMAAVSIIRHPVFFWDNLVFQRGVKALCGQLYDPDCLQECHPAEMAWALYEAMLLRGLDPEDNIVPKVDDDVKQYIAVCLLRAGYVYPPKTLLFVAENLEMLLPEENRKYVERVKNGWDHTDKRNLQERRFLEDALDIQIAQLASCYLYVEERSHRMAEEITQLTSPSH